VSVRAALTVGALALAASGGYLVGAWRTSSSPPLAVDRDRAAAVARLDADALRVIVREEVARGNVGARSCPPVPSTSATAPLPTPAAAASAPDPSAQLAVAHAYDVIDRALQAGSWSDKDRVALRRAMTGASQADADDIQRKLYSALHDGRLKVAFSDVPL
jgi:hypothetical protein